MEAGAAEEDAAEEDAAEEGVAEEDATEEKAAEAGEGGRRRRVRAREGEGNRRALGADSGEVWGRNQDSGSSEIAAGKQLAS